MSRFLVQYSVICEREVIANDEGEATEEIAEQLTESITMDYRVRVIRLEILVVKEID
jgi:hypothetical protein